MFEPAVVTTPVNAVPFIHYDLTLMLPGFH